MGELKESFNVSKSHSFKVVIATIERSSSAILSGVILSVAVVQAERRISS